MSIDLDFFLCWFFFTYLTRLDQPILTHLDQFGRIKTYLDLLGAIWRYLELFVAICSYLELFGAI